ncbi:MAG: hypothetical protein HYT94_02540 [Parcubacteria group bacterium]|nr:hypothetical protein [Parcubacteria group bacterium]
MNTSRDTLDVLRSCDVDPVRGFLPPTDPKTTFFFDPPSDLTDKLQHIEGIGEALPILLRADDGSLAREIKRMPMISASEVFGLSTRAAKLFSARLKLSAHGYVWERWKKDIIRQSLPPNLAVPLLALAERFRVSQALEYDSYALCNWKRKDPGAPITPENLKLIQNFLGGESEEWFVVMHVAIELAAAPIAVAAWELGEAIDENDICGIFDCLHIIVVAMAEVNALMRRMTEHCDTEIYFRDVRPYLYGWNDKKNFPNGMLYQTDSSGHGRYLSVPGETGAQSRIIPCLDRILGVTHVPGSLSEHLHAMLHVCTPEKQRNFVLSLEDRSSLSAETAGLYGKEVEVLYWVCRRLLSEFRAIHYYYTVQYIQKPARLVKHPFDDKASGGSPYVASLWKHFEETLGDRLTEEMGGAKNAFMELIKPFALS